MKLLLEKSLNRITTGHFRRTGSKNISKEAGRLGRHIWRLENRPNLAGKIDSHWGGNHFMANRCGNNGNSQRRYFITADGDCSHEIKRHLLLGRKAMRNLESIPKNRDITLLTKVHLVKAMVLPVVLYGCEFSSVAHSCPTLCDPMNCSMLGFPVHHQHPGLTETHVHRISDAIQPSHLLSPSAAFNLPQHQGLF